MGKIELDFELINEVDYVGGLYYATFIDKSNERYLVIMNTDGEDTLDLDTTTCDDLTTSEDVAITEYVYDNKQYFIRLIKNAY